MLLVQSSVAAKILEETFCISGTSRASEMLPVWSLDHAWLKLFQELRYLINDFLHLLNLYGICSIVYFLVKKNPENSEY